MDSSRDALQQKFSGLKSGGATRRVDYKGLRRRLNLRLPPDISIDLAIIKLVTGEDKNACCERILGAGIKEIITKLKGQHDAQAWETITKCATPARK